MKVEIMGANKKLSPSFRKLEPGTVIKLTDGTECLVIDDSGLAEGARSHGRGIVLLTYGNGFGWFTMGLGMLHQAEEGKFIVLGKADKLLVKPLEEK